MWVVGCGLYVVVLEQVLVEQYYGFDCMVDWIYVVDGVIGFFVYEFCIGFGQCVYVCGNFCFVDMIGVVGDYQYWYVVFSMMEDD